MIHSRRRFPGVLVFALVFFASIEPCRAAKWAPVAPQELADNAPRVDPEAGAEILFRETTVTHELGDEIVRVTHVRAKIFSERGLDHFAKVDLPHDGDSRISDVEVRTIKPSGEIVELTKKDVFERQVLKAGRERVNVTSFSPAALETGAIVEYTYRQITRGWAWHVILLFQSDLPARHVRLRFQSNGSGVLKARAMFFNCPKQSMETTRGYYTFEMRDVPAAKNEPFQPPLLHVQSGVLICYSLGEGLEPAAYWMKFSQDLYERMRQETKATRLVRATLESIVAESDSDEQKLRKIYDYCRTKLINRYSDIANFSRQQRGKFEPSESASETIRLGHGTIEDINAAFVALARAAGIDARYVAANNNTAVFFQAAVTEPFMVSDLIAAVELDGKWRYFDPGVRYLPFGTPHWQNSATTAIIAAPKGVGPVAVGFAAPEVSQDIRRADFELEPDGTLAGEVHIEYTGYRGSKLKTLLDAKTTPEREAYVRDELQEYLKLAEITAIKVEHADDPIVPLQISYTLRVPSYADRTGSRLFFRPAVFQKNVPQLFTEATRKNLIAFPYCYAEGDSIRIKLPEGYELEEATAPTPLNLGNLASYTTNIGVRKDRTLIYNRSFALHAPRILASDYGTVRSAFARVHQRDGHTLTLKRKESVASPLEPRATETVSSAR